MLYSVTVYTTSHPNNEYRNRIRCFSQSSQVKVFLFFILVSGIDLSALLEHL